MHRKLGVRPSLGDHAKAARLIAALSGRLGCWPERQLGGRAVGEGEGRREVEGGVLDACQLLQETQRHVLGLAPPRHTGEGEVGMCGCGLWWLDASR